MFLFFRAIYLKLEFVIFKKVIILFLKNYLIL